MRRMLMVLALVSGAALLAGCSGCSIPESYIQADRATYDVIAPEFLNYLEKDEALDPKIKEARALTVHSWDLRLRKAEGK